jgi:hypothetical protein
MVVVADSTAVGAEASMVVRVEADSAAATVADSMVEDSTEVPEAGGTVTAAGDMDMDGETAAAGVDGVGVMVWASD